MFCRPGDGLLYFRLFKASQLVQAYAVAREIVVSRVGGGGRESKCHVAVSHPFNRRAMLQGHVL